MTPKQQKDIAGLLTISNTLAEADENLKDGIADLTREARWGLWDGWEGWRPPTTAGIVTDDDTSAQAERMRSRYRAGVDWGRKLARGGDA